MEEVRMEEVEAMTVELLPDREEMQDINLTVTVTASAGLTGQGVAAGVISTGDVQF